jgi:hypothetical protein
MISVFLTVDGIPGVKWFGSEGDYNVLVIDLLGEQSRENESRRGEKRREEERREEERREKGRGEEREEIGEKRRE